jgi:hypothetical protein
MAKQLLNGKQTFLDANGAPLSGGSVYHYIPSTTTFKNTWTDEDESVLNTNPVVLDSAGRAVIWGSGVYRQILKDSLGNTIWDQIVGSTDATASGAVLWGGTSAGSANAQTITVGTYDSLDGKIIIFLAGYTNTGAATLTVNAEAPGDLLKDSDTGPVPLTGGEVFAGNLITAVWDSGAAAYHMASGVPTDLILDSLTVNQLVLAGHITPAALSADVNDWAPTDVGTNVRISVSSTLAVRITGLVAAADGFVHTVENVGAYNVTLSVADSASVASARFRASGDVVLRPGDSVILIYDTAVPGWNCFAQPSASAATLTPPKGLVLVNGTDADHDVDIDAEQLTVVDSLGKVILLEAVNLTVAIDASGANGLDTGTVAIDTGYFLFVIYDAAASTTAGLFSLSATAPTLPTGYTYFRRVGWIVTDSGAVLLRFRQRGDEVRYTSGTLPILAEGTVGSTTIPTWVAASVSAYVPSTAEIIHVSLRAPSGSGWAIAAPNNSYGAHGDANPPPMIALDGASVLSGLLLESTSLYFASDASGGIDGKLLCYGWKDKL